MNSTARADAQKLVARRRRRISLIRKRAIAGSAAAFVSAWAVIAFQLVSGHDPALSKTSQAAVVPSASAASKKKSGARSAVKRSSSTSAPSTSSGSTSTGSSSASSSQQVAPVTTRQS